LALNNENNNRDPEENKPDSIGNNSENDIDELLDIMHKNNKPTGNAKPSESPSGEAASILEHLTSATVSPSDADKTRQIPKARPAAGVTKAPIPNDNCRTRVDNEAVRPPVSFQPHHNQSTAVPPVSRVSESKGVSLDDFEDVPVQGANMQSSSKQKKSNKRSHSTGVGLVKIAVYLIAVVACSLIISIFTIKVGNDVFAFVKSDEEITVTIPENATTDDIAKILKENGVIKYPSIYEKYAAFRIKRRSYLTGEYLSGEHTVSPSMNYDQLLEALSVMKSSNRIVRITIPEGYTVKEILELFEKNGMKAPSEYNEAIEEAEYDYRFMDEMKEGKGISSYRFDVNYGYRLEGYLFPDTYDFYVDEEPTSVINKLLTNFNAKFDTTFYTRCYELGYSVDQIITLASMIEREGNTVGDYAKISSVFYNRLKNSSAYPYLESDATVQYALGNHKEKLDSSDTSIDNPYNTYKYKGLPPGPICNPGYEAIYAALYPEDTDNYYFLSRNDGTTVYSKTYEQHLAAIAESNELDARLAAEKSGQ